MRTKSPELKETIVKYVNKYFDCSLRSPCLREIGENLNIAKPTAMRYLKEMANDGSLEYDGQNIITPYIRNKLTTMTVNIPVIGSIPCGVPSLEFEQKGECIEIPVSFIGEGSYFVLVASGDSMIGAGIDDGDLIIVRQTNEARVGQVVVALDENRESTLKRYCLNDNGIPYLHPENSKYKDIYPTELVIQGVAVKVIKDME